MKRAWLNRKYLLRRSWQITGSVYAVIGLAGMLANLDELIFPTWDTWKRVLFGIVILFVLWLVILVGCCLQQGQSMHSEGLKQSPCLYPVRKPVFKGNHL